MKQENKKEKRNKELKNKYMFFKIVTENKLQKWMQKM